MVETELTLAVWLGRIIIGILVIGLGVVYGRGWTRLQTAAKPPQRWQTATFVIGLSLVGFTLISEFATLAAHYYSVREIQHILLTGLVPLLLLVSDPIMTLVAGLPQRAQHRLHKWNNPGHPIHHWLRIITSPGLVWVLFVAIFWLWHDPYLIAAVQRSYLVRVIEIVSLMGIALLYWWQIAEARPRLHRPMYGLVRLGYVFAGMLPIKLLGLFLLFGNETIPGGHVVYDPAEIIQIGHLMVADQSLAALILWGMGGFTYTYSAIFLAGKQMGVEGEKSPRPVSVLEEDETWRAPAIRR